MSVVLRCSKELDDSDYDGTNTGDRLVDLGETDVRVMESRYTIVNELGSS